MRGPCPPLFHYDKIGPAFFMFKLFVGVRTSVQHTDAWRSCALWFHLGTPIMACTATATRVIKADVLAMLEMRGCTTVSIPPNRPNNQVPGTETDDYGGGFCGGGEHF